MNIEEFIKQNGITLELTRLPDTSDQINYHAVLSMGNRKIETPFHTGVGWIEDKKGEFTGGMYSYDPKTKKIVPSGFWNRRVTMYDVEEATKNYRIRKPSTADILDSLASDASIVDNVRTFEEFCGELGYDSDSRKAEKMYYACLEEANQLRQFLGHALYETLLYEVERQ